ncbi:hypothetical protein KR009_011648 [Drosophila setifemur]|nr:hypothetical protein KR009_011648 [Drosophila setifemur]
MPSVGSTPTTTSPSQQLQQQQPQQQQQQQPLAMPAPQQQLPRPRPLPLPLPLTLPAPPQQQQQQQQTSVSAPVAKRRLAKLQAKPSLQLQYLHYQPQQQLHHQHPQPHPPHHPSVTTTQPALAGVFAHNNNNNASSASTSSGNVCNNNNNDLSPVSNSNSYSSVDTNQTLLNTLANPQRKHRDPNQRPVRSPKYSQFMIITPAVSIDRDVDYESHLDFEDFANAAHNNGNLFRLGLRRSDSSSSGDSGHSSNSSGFRSNYNPYLHHSRQHLLSKGGGAGGGGGGGGASRHFYAFTSSWRWCSLLCAAMRCFGAGGGGTGNAPYSSSLQHHRLRRCSSYTAENAYEHFAAPFKARKTRDHMNNITYEL